MEIVVEELWNPATVRICAYDRNYILTGCKNSTYIFWEIFPIKWKIETIFL